MSDIITGEVVDKIKENWIMYNCSGWIGVHKTTKKMIKCGTYIALLNAIYHCRDISK